MCAKKRYRTRPASSCGVRKSGDCHRPGTVCSARKSPHRIATNLDDGSHVLNQKLTAWYDLDFRGFRKEVKKAFKTDIPLSERADWEAALATWQSEHQVLTARLIDTETAINDRVYALFNLAPAERQTLHNHMEKAMINYPLGQV